MTPTLHKEITDILNGNPFHVKARMLKLMETVEVIEEAKDKTKKPRTLSQNAAMWLEHQKVADELIKSGVTMRKIFESTESFDIPPTKDNVHELWLYFQKIMYPSMPSSRDLPKHGDHYQKIHDVMMKNLGEKWSIEYVDFPSSEKVSKLNLIELANKLSKEEDNFKMPTI